jgi:hypothetical protein
MVDSGFLPRRLTAFLIGSSCKLTSVGLSNELRTIQSEAFAHENPKTKGEIYLKMRHYQRINDQQSARRWEARLSPSDVRGLLMLQKHPRVQRAFDQFLSIPALLHNDALLSVWHKILACNCDNVLGHFPNWTTEY